MNQRLCTYHMLVTYCVCVEGGKIVGALQSANLPTPDVLLVRSLLTL